MKILNIKNPFGAAVYHEETLSSTFDAARMLAEQAEAHGTVICADFQEVGRGRPKPGLMQGRPWFAERGKCLLFTILLRYKDFSFIPPALTLRTGLALSFAIEELIPSLKDAVQIKWPNDIMIGSRKIAGILAEADGKNVYIGVGVNVAQGQFPEELSTGNPENPSKAISLIQVYPELAQNVRYTLLEKILFHLYKEIEKPAIEKLDNCGSLHLPWQERLYSKLYKRGETVTFVEGSAESGCLIKGVLSGIGKGGELLIIPLGEENERAFVTGELRVY